MKKLKINREDLQLGFELDPMNGTGYLDTQTGEVVMVFDDLKSGFEDLEIDVDEADLDTIIEALQTSDALPAWQRESMIPVAHILYGKDPDRFLELPGQDSRAGYEMMEDFIETLENEQLQELLTVAIQGKGAFRRFKDVLDRYPETQQAWYQFQQEQQTQHMIRWLHAEDIDPEFM